MLGALPAKMPAGERSPQTTAWTELRKRRSYEMRCYMRSHAVRYLRRYGERETPGEMCSWRHAPHAGGVHLWGGSAAGGGPTLEQ